MKRWRNKILQFCKKFCIYCFLNLSIQLLALIVKCYRRNRNVPLVDLARIGLAPPVCKTGVLPLYYKPMNPTRRLVIIVPKVRFELTRLLAVRSWGVCVYRFATLASQDGVILLTSVNFLVPVKETMILYNLPIKCRFRATTLSRTGLCALGETRTLKGFPIRF